MRRHAMLNHEDFQINLNALNEGNFKKILIGLDQLSSSPTEFILTSYLCATSGVIGKHAFYELQVLGRLYLNLWAVLIGPSTVTKKTSTIKMITAYLEEKEQELYDEYKRAVASMGSGSSMPSRDRIFLPSDSTVEKLSEILTETKRGLLSYSEFGALLKQLGRKYAGDAKQFLAMIYDAPKLYEVSRIGRGSIVLRYPYVSLIGGSTMTWLKENSSRSDLLSGFFARFLFSIVKQNNKPNVPLLELTENPAIKELMKETYDFLLALPETKLTISAEAKAMYNDYDDEMFREMDNEKDDLTLSFKGRLKVSTLKIAGVIALINRCTEVSTHDMEDAILISNYYKNNIETLLLEDLTADHEVELEKKIIGIIEKHGGEIRHSDLCNHSGLRADHVRKIVASLVEKEKIRVEQRTNPQNGRSGSYYVLLSD